MAIEKFVLRLLSADNALLAWAEVYASPRPQQQVDADGNRRSASCPYFPTDDLPTPLPVVLSGVATKVSIHWCDLDIARVMDLLEPLTLQAGQLASFSWALTPVWLVAGMRDVPLPAVTVTQAITVGVPVGSMVGAT